MSIYEEMETFGQMIYSEEVLSKLEALKAYRSKMDEIKSLKLEIRELKAEIRDMRLGITI